MARNEESNRVAGNRAPRRPRRLRATNLFGHATVGDDLPGRHAQQGAPDGQLEVGPTHMDGQRGTLGSEGRREDGPRQCCCRRFVAFQRRPPPGPVESLLLGGNIPVGHKPDPADTALGPGDEDRPKR